jgi:DNA ligase-1
LLNKLLILLLLVPLTVASSPALQHAKTLKKDVDLAHFWVSEKLDGVRGYWNGEQLLTRQGNTINAPTWFTNRLPKVKLDGELWIDREEFERVSGIVRKRIPLDTEWRNIKFMIFDIPEYAQQPFHRRINIMRDLVSELEQPHIQIVPQFRVKDQQHLEDKLQKVINLGGEGLMLHHTSARYRSGRSNDFYKFKKHYDKEAVVLEHLPGQGKFSGMMGSLLVKLPDGKQFKIGSGFKREDRVHPPAIGDVITFKHYGYTKNGIPKFASYLRTREDF